MIRGLWLLLLSCAAFSATDPNLPKWANADAWNLKLCENMTEGKVLSLLGPPRLIWENRDQSTWFYQQLPEIVKKKPKLNSNPKAVEKTNPATDKVINQSLDMPKDGYVMFRKEKSYVLIKEKSRDSKGNIITLESTQPITDKNRSKYPE